MLWPPWQIMACNGFNDLRSSEVPGTIPLDNSHGHIFHEHRNSHDKNVSLNNATYLFHKSIFNYHSLIILETLHYVRAFISAPKPSPHT